MFIAIKTEDGRNKGKIAFYCKILGVTRQGFYHYLKTKDLPWKYQALAENAEFRAAIEATQNAELCHRIGGQNSRTTVLTESEFIRQLYRLRSKLYEEGIHHET